MTDGSPGDDVDLLAAARHQNIDHVSILIMLDKGATSRSIPTGLRISAQGF